MIYLEKEIIGNMLVVHHPEGACNRNDHNYDECVYHDDYPDSWMMAEDAYFEINGAPVKKKPVKTPTVPNMVDDLLNKGTVRDPKRNSGRGETSYE